MAKDQSNKSLLSKVTFGLSRRISHCPKNKPNPSPSTNNNTNVKQFVSHTPQIPLHQPVSNEVAQGKPTKKFVRFLSSNIKKPSGGGKELDMQKTFSEDKYNSYIDDTKKKMRAPSNVSGGRTVSRRESFNDMFSGYISRTKMRLRTTSTAGTTK